MPDHSSAARLRELPAVHRLLNHPVCLDAASRWSPALVSKVAAEVIGELRAKIVRGEGVERWTLDSLAHEVQQQARDKFNPRLKKVVNATGIVLHTNLGRAPLADAAIEAIRSVSLGYSNLELDLATGERGSRYSHVENILCRLTGAESALVVNNNAAAVFLILRELAQGREVIVSRGQLVEIGGSFRVSEVMRESGAHLVEVGTTNKTHANDYETAISPETSLVMRVHTSNFRMIGFTAQPDLADLVSLSHLRGIPVYEDLGSGSIVDLRARGIGDEPNVRASVEAGVDVISFSGDKLLGGGQAGIIVGKQALISRLRRNQLTRALRIDKLTLAALEATLLLYQDEEIAFREIPTLRMLTEPVDLLMNRATYIQQQISSLVGQEGTVDILESTAYVGGGSLPDEAIPSLSVAVKLNRLSPDQFESLLREQPVPVLCLIRKEAVLFDVRTILEDDVRQLIESIAGVIRTCSSDNPN